MILELLDKMSPPIPTNNITHLVIRAEKGVFDTKDYAEGKNGL